MKRNISKINKKTKKGVSLILSYVLLVVIALALALGVYTWLKFIAGGAEDIEECPEGVSLILQEYKCFSGAKIIELTLRNKGRFNIDGSIIKGTANKSQDAWFNLKLVDNSNVQELAVPGTYKFPSPLAPDASQVYNFSYAGLGTLEKVGIIPIQIHENQSILCESTISQEVNC